MSKIATLQNLLVKDPDDSMARYMLANELYKDAQFAEAATELEAYLKAVEDEGAAYRILAECYVQTGKKKEARWVLRQGAEAARVHHHEGMAEEFETREKEI
jgi:predicted Zn-dependent protease